MVDRCYIDAKSGVLIPGCDGAAYRGAAGCYCDPTPRGIAAMARREDAEDRQREAEQKAREDRLATKRDEAAEKWRAGGGVPRIVKASGAKGGGGE